MFIDVVAPCDVDPVARRSVDDDVLTQQRISKGGSRETVLHKDGEVLMLARSRVQVQMEKAPWWAAGVRR